MLGGILSGTQNAGAEMFERLLGTPIVGRDRILRAYSPDGRNWTKDANFVFRLADPFVEHMDYGVARDPQNRLWFRVSEFSHPLHRWTTVIYSDGKRFSIGPDLKQVFSPCWVDQALWVVGVDGSGTRSVQRLTQRNGALEPIDPGTWEKLNAFETLEDVFITRLENVYHAWCSVGTGHRTAPHHWTSRDTKLWKYLGPAWPGDPSIPIANNPCVVQFQNSWRMYFRSGSEVALHNTIRCAESRDLTTWKMDDKPCLGPGGKFDSHGIGFPFVFNESSLWWMYYAGYWGRCRQGTKIERQWRERQIATSLQKSL